MKPVKDIDVSGSEEIDGLVKRMYESGGFVAKKVGVAVDILESMLREENCLKFLSFPACIVATGTRGVIKELIKKKMFDAVVTTCGTLDHDLARSFKEYYHGSFLMNDVELREKGICRLGNVLVPNESYGLIIEEKMRKFLNGVYKDDKDFASYELAWKLGEFIGQADSILYWAWKNKVPVVVPGITDGAVGYHLWEFYQEHNDFRINVLKDEQLLSDLVWGANKSGALILGGGISKHHVIWWNAFRDGLDYAVYITTAAEWDGSLSGARMREAVSWSQLRKNAEYVTVEGDVTVLLPLIAAALLKRLEGR